MSVELTAADPALIRSPVMFGDAGILDSVLLLGRRPRGHVKGVMELAGPGAVWRRRLDTGLDADMNDGDERWRDWRRSIENIDH